MVVKCANCKNAFDKSSMIRYEDKFHKNAKIINICSQKCVKEYEETENNKIKSHKEYIELCDLIMDIHKTKMLPSSFFVLLNDAHDGIIRSGGQATKTKNGGVSWGDLYYAYQYSAKAIQQANRSKSFTNIVNELRYGFAIIRNNFPKAMQDKQRKNQARKEISQIVEINETVYVKKVDKNDISDLL